VACPEFLDYSRDQTKISGSQRDSKVFECRLYGIRCEVFMRLTELMGEGRVGVGGG
jgi:hypothetical protein